MSSLRDNDAIHIIALHLRKYVGVFFWSRWYDTLHSKLALSQQEVTRKLL